MAFDYINEAFKRLDLLEEEMFDTSLHGINQLSDFMDNDSTDEIIRVIDPEADTPEEIQDSYVGKVIINCNVCHSHIFENKEEIKIEEDGSVNIEMHCPYCNEQEGFTIVGEIAPFETAVEEPAEEEPAEEVAIDDSVEEPISEIPEDSLDESSVITEDFKEVSITTDDQHMEMTSDDAGKVTITTEPINVDTTEEVIHPLSAETTEEILANNDVSDADEVNEDEFDFDFDDIDEEGMNELGESYLKNVYDNVSSFKTTDVSANSHTLIVEGVITFNSGATKKTGFLFEALDANEKGQVRFRGLNKHFTEAADAYSLVGHVDNKKLFVESLKYNYTVNNTPIRGLARRK